MRRFPSIKKNREFQNIYHEARSYANRLLVMYVKKRDGEGSRIGVSCSKKIGNSVVRHTVTRRLREIFRLNRERLATGADIIIVVRRNAETASYQDLEKAYLELCGRHHIILLN